MAHRRILLMPSGSKEKEPRYIRTYLSEAKASLTHTVWADISFFAPLLLHKGLLVSPVMWRRLLRELGSLRRPITTLRLSGCEMGKWWDGESREVKPDAVRSAGWETVINKPLFSQNVIATRTEPFLDKSRPLHVVYIATHCASPPCHVTNPNKSEIQQGWPNMTTDT